MAATGVWLLLLAQSPCCVVCDGQYLPAVCTLAMSHCSGAVSPSVGMQTVRKHLSLSLNQLKNSIISVGWLFSEDGGVARQRSASEGPWVRCLGPRTSVACRMIACVAFLLRAH